jgi:hypothetical protein
MIRPINWFIDNLFGGIVNISRIKYENILKTWNFKIHENQDQD